MKPLGELPDSLLFRRLDGLSMNLFFSNNRLFIPSDVERAFYATLAEVRKRGSVPPLKVETFISPNDPAPVFHNKFVVRYSSIDRLRQFTSGQVSFTPASNYEKLPNDAQRDNEMRRSWFITDQTVEIAGTPYMLREGSLSHEMRKKSGELATYHTLCMSVEESRKLQHAFGAEGYVLIHDYQAFYDIVTEGVANKYGPIARSSGAVKYYDDLEGHEAKNLRDLAFTKEITYKYQREARLAILEAQPANDFLAIKVSWPKGLISEIQKFS